MESNEKIATIIENGRREKMMCCQNGFIGPIGPTGATGSNGKDGLNGQNGMNGKDGLMGPTGVQGVEGNVGPTGMPGPQGEQGVAGKNGISGIQGSQGIKGIDGHNGIMGPTGPIGLQGNHGRDGTSIQIMGNYNTLSDLQQAHPTGNVGDSYLANGDLYFWDGTNKTWDSIGRIQGPTGPAGKDGTHGDIGLIGPQGEVGLIGPTGPAGDKGETGLLGPAGISFFSNHMIAETNKNVTMSKGLIAFPIGFDYFGDAGTYSNRTNNTDFILPYGHIYMIELYLSGVASAELAVTVSILLNGEVKNTFMSGLPGNYAALVIFDYVTATSENENLLQFRLDTNEITGTSGNVSILKVA